MNRHRIRLNGQNFLLNLQGEPRRYSFYTTRDVEAVSFEEAESKAVDLIRNDDSLKKSSPGMVADSPMIFVEEIRILKPDEERLENSGYTFYTE
jgi:hypothetical protein